MKYIDIIKNNLIDNFTGTVSIGHILSALIISFLVSIFIVYIYRKTYTGVVYSKSFSLCLILLSMVTSLIICTINSNLSLSLGMVGALSIVRFRTAIKEPVDTVFMFWTISVGIMSGAGLYIVVLIASLVLGLLYFISYTMGFKSKKQYLLILKYYDEHDNFICEKVKGIGKTKLKSKSISGNTVEASYEIEAKDDVSNILNNFKLDSKVINASIISYQNDFGA